MTLIFAPVSFSNSGARRCNGSWIAPVCVMMFTVTPSNSPACAPTDEASANNAPTIAVDMFRIFAMLSFLPDLVGVRAPRYFCFAAAPSLPMLRRRLRGQTVAG